MTTTNNYTTRAERTVMSATDELRKLLDERGIEYETDDTQIDSHGAVYYTTYAKCGYGRTWVYEEPPDCALLVSYVYDLGAEEAVEVTLGREVDGNTSDGYHTFNELYHHRAVLFSVIVQNFPDKAWKSKLHHTGDMYDGMFIVGIDTPEGQATYHYNIDPYWDMFECKELDRAPEWDGHTPAQAIERIAKLRHRTCHVIISDNLAESEGTGDAWADCSECGHLLYVLTEPNSEPPNFCPNCGAKVVD